MFMDVAWQRIECQGDFATGMPIRGVIEVRQPHALSDGGMPHAMAGTATPGTNGLASCGELGVPMTSGEERDEQNDKRSSQTEDHMREAPPPSELGDVEDAVAPEVGGELTPWSPPRRDEEESDA